MFEIIDMMWTITPTEVKLILGGGIVAYVLLTLKEINENRKI